MDAQRQKSVTALRVKNIEAYLINKYKRINTTFVVTPHAVGYLEEGKLVDVLEFERVYPVNIESAANTNVDGTRNWY